MTYDHLKRVLDTDVKKPKVKVENENTRHKEPGKSSGGEEGREMNKDETPIMCDCDFSSVHVNCYEYLYRNFGKERNGERTLRRRTKNKRNACTKENKKTEGKMGDDKRKDGNSSWMDGVIAPYVGKMRGF